MKKIKILSLLLVAIAFAGTGCLKDKGFDNHEYGINDPDNSPAGVGFLNGIRFRNVVGLNLSPDPQIITTELTVSVLAAKIPTSAVTVRLQLDPTIVTDYNAANGTSISPLDPSLYSITSLDLVIPAGSKNVAAELKIPSTVTLNPNETYGLGFKIVSADGYVIATNQNQILLEIGLKNKYDGIYSLNGVHNRPPATTYGYPYRNVEMFMITAGVSDIAFFFPDVDDYGHPIGVGPSTLSWYGTAIGPVITFDPATDKVANVFNAGGATPIGLYTGTIPTNNYYDPATKTIYVAWQYNNNPDRAFFDTLVFKSAR